MNIFLWILQGFLSLTFAYSGICKTFLDREWLVSHRQTGVARLSYPFIRFIGISEILGAIGVVVPWLTGIAPELTPISALGFALIMVPASIIHFNRKEFGSVAFSFFVFVIALVVAWGRLLLNN